MLAYRRVQGHTAVSNGSLFNWFNTPGHAVSHFYVLADGTVEQYIDTKFRSSATLEGNPDSITIETEDMGAPFPIWTGSNVPAWTPEQVLALAMLIDWTHRIHAIPIVLCPSSKAGTKGCSYHRQGIDPWRISGGQYWSKSAGKVCPGDRRVNQWINDVIPLAQSIAGGNMQVDLTDAAQKAVANEVWAKLLNNLASSKPGAPVNSTAGNLLRYIHLRSYQAVRLLEDPAEMAAAIAAQLPPDQPANQADIEAGIRAVLGSLDETPVT
jgi:hypothetical protein